MKSDGTAGEDRTFPQGETRALHSSAQILVCDDSISDRTLLKTLLRRRFKSIDLVVDGESAIAAVAEKSYDVLLLDVELPSMSGIEVVRRIREIMRASGHYLPIILLTARTAQQDKLDGLKAGATDFLTKPFDPAELIARITNHVQVKQLQDRLRDTNRLLEEERSKVVRVQLGLLPKTMPSIRGLDFGAFYQPSGMASGDYYDIIERPDGKILLAVGDVSGHGIPSAMYMSVIRASLRTQALQKLNICEILTKLNHLLIHALDDFSFVTFSLSEFDAATGLLVHASAGHPFPLLYDAAEDSMRELEGTPSLPLGIDDNLCSNPCEWHLSPGQRLLVYTDGLTEQVSPLDEQFGVEGLKNAMQSASSQPPADACKFIAQSVRTHAAGVALQDDLTLLMMQLHADSGS